MTYRIFVYRILDMNGNYESSEVGTRESWAAAMELLQEERNTLGLGGYVGIECPAITVDIALDGCTGNYAEEDNEVHTES